MWLSPGDGPGQHHQQRPRVHRILRKRRLVIRCLQAAGPINTLSSRYGPWVAAEIRVAVDPGLLGVRLPTEVGCRTLKTHLAEHPDELAGVVFYGFQLHEQLMIAEVVQAPSDRVFTCPTSAARICISRPGPGGIASAWAPVLVVVRASERSPETLLRTAAAVAASAIY